MTQPDLTLRHEDLVENPTPRVPVCLCLDVSSSMGGEPIAELNGGVMSFIEALRADEIARYAAEVSVVTFGGIARSALDFAALDRQTFEPQYADGGTPMGEGVGMALDMLERRKREYAAAGIDYYQPWLVLMTDGQPTDAIDASVRRVVDAVEARKLTVFPIGIGGGADMNVLARFSPNRAPLRLAGLKFQDFFAWLSRSVARVSQSIPGQNVPLDVKGISGWAQV